MIYRREIDGLRTLAVLPVILFHAGLKVFSGGFVGVDVFFVISGYLITSLLIAELERGDFSIARFYERRARRILPALLFMIVCCIPFAWMWLAPSLFEDFSRSIIAVVFFASNVLFWLGDSYFAPTAELKPLLHTWSLAVEEQYYVLFPVFLAVLWRFGRNRVFWAIVGVAIVSLLLCDWASRHATSANYYLAPTRAWELLIGSISAFWAFGKPQKNSNWVSIVGLGLIVFSIFYYDDTTPFPSLYALAPVLGAALIILYAGAETWVGKILSTPIFVGIGLISYSAYLWHQPLFAFARIYNITEPPLWVMLTLAALSLLMAYLSWRYVEQPFRKGSAKSLLPTRRSVFAASACGGVALIAFGLYGYLSNGAMVRYSYARSYIEYFDNDPPANHFIFRTGMIKAFRYECDFLLIDGKTVGRAKQEISPGCYTRDPNLKKAVFIWGDSHAQMFYAGLKEKMPADWQILQVASSGCGPMTVPRSSTPEYCKRSNKLAATTIAKTVPDVVVLSQVKKWDMDHLNTTLSWLKSVGVKHIVVMGPSPRWSIYLPWIMVRNWSAMPSRTWQGVDTSFFGYDRDMQRALATRKGDGITYVSILGLLCDRDGCLTYRGKNFREGYTTWDYGHLSPWVSSLVAKSVLVDAIVSKK